MQDDPNPNAQAIVLFKDNCFSIPARMMLSDVLKLKSSDGPTFESNAGGVITAHEGQPEQIGRLV